VLAVLAVAVAVVVSVNADPTTADELAKRLARSVDPRLFSLRYERGGTEVLGCVLVNTRFVLDVDTDAETVVVRVDNEIVAMADEEVLLLGRALFRGELPTPWLDVPRRDAATDPAVRRVLGADLAGYLLAAQPPATGRATAAAALDAARDVTPIDPITISGHPVDGYRVRLDADRFTAAATLTTEDATEPTPTSAPVLAPVIDVWVAGDGTVARIAIRPLDEAGEPRPAEDGWTVDYSPATSSPSWPGSIDITGVDIVDPGLLAAAPVDCALGG